MAKRQPTQHSPMEAFLLSHKESLLSLVTSEGWKALTELIDTECFVILDRLFDLPLAAEQGNDGNSYDMRLLYAYHKGQLAMLRLFYNLEVSIRTLDIEPEEREEYQNNADMRLGEKFKNFYRNLVGAIFRK